MQLFLDLVLEYQWDKLSRNFVYFVGNNDENGHNGHFEQFFTYKA